MIHLPGIRRPRRWPDPIPSAMLLVAAKYKVRHNWHRVFPPACPDCESDRTWCAFMFDDLPLWGCQGCGGYFDESTLKGITDASTD